MFQYETGKKGNLWGELRQPREIATFQFEMGGEQVRKVNGLGPEDYVLFLAAPRSIGREAGAHWSKGLPA